MSKEGAPNLEVRAEGLRVAIIAARWHDQVMTGLLDGACRALDDAAVSDPTVLRVPGTFELAAAAARLAPRHDALVALGVVIRGGTPHFEYVCEAATVGLTEVSVRLATPVGFGVLTCDNEQQALERSGPSDNKGYEAATAAVALAVGLRQAGF